MKFLCCEKISEHRYKTPEGYLVCVDSVLARTGKQTYTRGEVFGSDCKDADKEIEVDRTPEEVFSDKTLASFENKPLTDEHPDEDVTINNHNSYSIGFVRDIKRGKTSDGEDVMLGTLVVTDSNAIEEIENGKTDLSCGYECDIEDDDNPCQRNIRGNHVALCQQGRAGIAHIVDSKVRDAKIKVGMKVKNGNELFIVESNDGEFAVLKSLTTGRRYKYTTYDLSENLEMSPKWSIVDSSTKDYNSVEETNERIEAIPLEARNDMKKANNKKAALLMISNEIDDVINAAEPSMRAELKTKKEKILSDLRKQFFDSTHDVDPHEGESKEDFISRFMSETKEEYPDDKQRLAVAYSYWEKKHPKDSLKRFEVEYKDSKNRTIIQIVKAKDIADALSKIKE